MLANSERRWLVHCGFAELGWLVPTAMTIAARCFTSLNRSFIPNDDW